MNTTQADQLQALYDKIDQVNYIKTQTVEVYMKMTTTEYRNMEIVFDELTEILGIVQITKYREPGRTYGHSQQVVTYGATGDANNNQGPYIGAFEGNVLKLTIYSGVNTTSYANWTFTCVGI